MTLRTFGALQWECEEPRQSWQFVGDWGKYRLRKYNGRVQVRGWYLSSANNLESEWVGKTLTEATGAAERVILADRRKATAKSDANDGDLR
ncbi:hypothetical protein ACIBBE_46555 [Streptomyces sp. NPDC051644]|uniref:hypothetical protein n=1 Tax=Streptomyces sp. NPDC051644 TaxID=3365666 RepID=UPI0037A0CC2A